MAFTRADAAVVFDADLGYSARVMHPGALSVFEAMLLTGPKFNSVVDPNFWSFSNSGAGSAAGITSTGVGVLTSGTALWGNGLLLSARRARFLFHVPNWYRGLVRMPIIKVPGTYKAWGAALITPGAPPAITDGFYFGYDGTTDIFSVNCVNNSVTTTVNNGAFNGETLSYLFDTNMHTYEIIYRNIEADFLIDGKLLHEFKATITPLCGDMNLKVGAMVINSSTPTTGASMEIWGNGVFRTSSVQPRPISTHIAGAATTTLKFGMGRLHRIVLGTATMGAITIYDNTAASGAILSVIDAKTSNAQPDELNFEASFENGLTIVTPAGVDMTVVYD